MPGPPPPPRKRKAKKAPPPPPTAKDKRVAKKSGPISETWTQCTIQIESKFHRGFVDLDAEPSVLTVERVEESEVKYGKGFMSEVPLGPYYSVLDTTDSQFKTIWGGHIEAGAQGVLYQPPKQKRKLEPPPPPPGKKRKKKRPPPPP